MTPGLPEREQQRGEQSTEPTCFSSSLHPQTCWSRELTTVFPFHIITEQVMQLYLASVSLAFQCFIENSSHSPQSSPKTGVGCCAKCVSIRKKEHRKEISLPPLIPYYSRNDRSLLLSKSMQICPTVSAAASLLSLHLQTQLAYCWFFEHTLPVCIAVNHILSFNTLSLET